MTAQTDLFRSIGSVSEKGRKPSVAFTQLSLKSSNVIKIER